MALISHPPLQGFRPGEQRETGGVRHLELRDPGVRAQRCAPADGDDDGMIGSSLRVTNGWLSVRPESMVVSRPDFGPDARRVPLNNDNHSCR